MGTYLRKNSRQGPQVPVLQPEKEALEVRGVFCLGAARKPLRLATCLSDGDAEARFAVTLVVH